MAETPNLGMVYVAAGQAGADQAHNDALNIIDVLLARGVVSRSVATPPAHNDGTAYIIAATATGEWAGHEGKVAMSWGGAWIIKTPTPGWTLWVEDENVVVTYRATAWKSIVGESIYAGRCTTNTLLKTSGTGVTNIPWDQDDRINSGVFDHDTVTNNHQITLKEAGDYLITLNLVIELVSGTAIAGEIRALLNGSPITGGTRRGWVRTTTGFTQRDINLTMLITAAANDVLSFDGVLTLGSDNDLQVMAENTSLVLRRV